jgi:hypothetical protein
MLTVNGTQFRIPKGKFALLDLLSQGGAGLRIARPDIVLGLVGGRLMPPVVDRSSLDQEISAYFDVLTYLVASPEVMDQFHAGIAVLQPNAAKLRIRGTQIVGGNGLAWQYTIIVNGVASSEPTKNMEVLATKLAEILGTEVPFRLNMEYSAHKLPFYRTIQKPSVLYSIALFGRETTIPFVNGHFDIPTEVV